MDYLLVLILGLLFLFGMITLLLGRLSHDLAPYPPQHQRNGHFFTPVVVTQYSDRVRAMQDRARDLLEEEPLRGYSDLLAAMLGWFGLARADDQGPARDQRVGRQDQVVEVPLQNRP